MYRFASPRLTKNPKNENKIYFNHPYFFPDDRNGFRSKQKDVIQEKEYLYEYY